jgi:CheY-like chemotaxis protein
VWRRGGKVTAGSDAGSNPPYAVLVVDDNDWNRDMLVRRLERQGFRVLAAADGVAALEAVERERLDLLLLDIMMPGLSGIEVLRRVRARHSAAELPVIMATAKGDSEDVVEALDAGANDYVTKPLDFPVVLARVKAQLRGRRPASLGPEAPPLTELGPGAVLAGRYRIEEKIGSGNFGTVFRSRHLGLDSDVALKVLQPAIGATEEAVARFQREAISACRIQHPNAVQVLDFGTTPEGVAFLVMELLSGVSLAEELKRVGPLGVERTAEILLPICDVLTEAHRAGVIHRDIKPANIFLHQSRRGEQIKVLDFGIAKLVGDAAGGQHLTVEGWVLGTPAYMAPERFGNNVYDGRADIYSLGVMLFQMLAGRTPFVAKSSDLMAMVMMHLQNPPPSLRELRPELPAEICDLVMATLRKTPAERPSAEVLAQDFARAAGLGAERGTWLSSSLPTVLLAAPPVAADPGARSAPRAGAAEDVHLPTAEMRPDRSPAGAGIRPQGELLAVPPATVAPELDDAGEAPPTRLYEDPAGRPRATAEPPAAAAVTPQRLVPATPPTSTPSEGDPLEVAASWDDGWMLSWEVTATPAAPVPGDPAVTSSATSPAAELAAGRTPEPAADSTADEPFTHSERLLLEDVGFLPPSGGLPLPPRQAIPAAPGLAEHGAGGVVVASEQPAGRGVASPREPGAPADPNPPEAPVGGNGREAFLPRALASPPPAASTPPTSGTELADLLFGALPVAEPPRKTRKVAEDLDLTGLLADLLRNPDSGRRP